MTDTCEASAFEEPLPDDCIEVRMNSTRWRGGPSGSIRFVFLALSEVTDIKVVEASDIPPQCIAIGGNVIGLVDDLASWESASPAHNGEMVEWIEETKPKIVFKYQFRNGVAYLPNTISAGFFCPYDISLPDDLLTRPRPIDVSARMRTGGYKNSRNDLSWMIARRQIVEQADRLSDEGFTSGCGKIAPELYLEELWDTKIGFNWEGFGRLTYRVPEYIRAGLVIITQPLGPEWPVREDLILEDGINCIFCDDPAKFGDEAKRLLKDERKMSALRKNVIELWVEKLCLRAMGRWYWDKLNEAL